MDREFLKVAIESIMMAALDELNLPHNGSDREEYARYSLGDREEAALTAAELSVGILLNRIFKVDIHDCIREFLPFRRACFNLMARTWQWETVHPHQLHNKNEAYLRRNEILSDKEFFDREFPGLYPDVSALADDILKLIG